VADGELDVVADQALEVAVGILVDDRRGADQLVHRLVEQRGEDLVLPREVPVEGGPADADPLSDLVDADPVEPLLVEEGGGGVQDLTVAAHDPNVAAVKAPRRRTRRRSVPRLVLE
jgi:hypothetical protein